ncbi:hypothetical protein S83_061518 [Arachis hypogaea]
MDSSLRAIEKLLREGMKLKAASGDPSFARDDVVEGSGSVNLDGEPQWPRKLKVADLPMFEGDGVEDWVFRARQYLETFNIPIEQRIRVLSFHLVGAAYAWYRWGVNNNIAYTWDSFLEALNARFGKNVFYDPRTALKELKQGGSVEEYQCQFEELSNRVTGLSEEWIVALFTAGLQEHLKCELLLARPNSYIQAVSLAKLHEQKHAVTLGLTKNNSSKSNSSFGPPNRFAPNRTLHPVSQLQKPITHTVTSSNPSFPPPPQPILLPPHHKPHRSRDSPAPIYVHAGKRDFVIIVTTSTAPVTAANHHCNS